MKIENKEQAFEFLTTNVKPNTKGPGAIGEVTIKEEVVVASHKAWSYNIDGVYMHGNITGTWILDTGEIVYVEAYGGDTIEKAYLMQYGKELI